MKKVIAVFSILTLLAFAPAFGSYAAEHGGKEHGGKSHSQEHGGKEHGGEAAATGDAVAATGDAAVLLEAADAVRASNPELAAKLEAMAKK